MIPLRRLYECVTLDLDRAGLRRMSPERRRYGAIVTESDRRSSPWLPEHGSHLPERRPHMVKVALFVRLDHNQKTAAKYPPSQ